MSDVVLFAVGSIVFIFLTWATLMFLYLRFNDVYRSDQAQTSGGPEIVAEGNLELLSAPEQPDS
jgi:hypothetical protein